ncbi:hypothetical protein E3J79_00970 [Candidatus Dependentiae bacterium]|nr:MAG: hypothetical protein E3J79_00970 [Candidatus Dependentiae bacterium]
MKPRKYINSRKNFYVTLYSTLLAIIFPIFLITTKLNSKQEEEQSKLLFEHNNHSAVIDLNSWLREENLLNTYQIDNVTINRESELSKAQKPKKDWTLIFYLAADNDLGPFAVRNIKQMANVGSTANMNIIIHLDIKTLGKKKVTRRFYVEKEKLIQVNINDPITQKMDSGDPQTLISCFKWGITNFPANKFALFLWDHGTGPLDPVTGRIFNANELFTYNATTNKLDLDRSIGFLEYISIIESLSKLEQRGICWDDSTGNYLTNQKLDFALRTICKECLRGGKIDLLGFDACLMNSIEIAATIKKYTHIMVGSQEVVLGSGWNYQKVLVPFLHHSLDPVAFAKHIVQAYDETYNVITNDYTQAAISLNHVELLEKNINSVATLLIESLKKQRNGAVKRALQTSRNKRNCTHFDEPSYIDLGHLYSNVLTNLGQFQFKNTHEEQEIKRSLKTLLEEGRKIIREIVIANKVGKNLRNASGLSIYFPEQRIHPSYKKTSFATSNHWLSFLTLYLLS